MEEGSNVMGRSGALFIGVGGYIATAVISGALALRKGLCGPAGMVTALDPFSGLGLASTEDLVFGGWEIRRSVPLESARGFFRGAQLPFDILPEIETGLKELEANIYEGTAANCGRAIEALAVARPASTLKDQVLRLRAEIRDFKKRNGVDTAVVVNLASTEPPLPLKPCHDTAEGFKQCVEKNRADDVRAGSLYALAAILEGCPYVNFTPSNSPLIPGLVGLAKAEGVPVMGNDGKTGETLVKSALIPMFIARNLEVLSWEGFNILGNMDGKVLDEPENRESKLLTKDRLLGKALGYSPHSGVHIHYVPSLDDQKTAWNFIHFRGFLGAKMSLQFIWQGYDSILAAPLVIDLVRLSLYAKGRGEAGLMTQLASFFKAPLGVDEHRLGEQFAMLVDYCAAGRKKR